MDVDGTDHTEYYEDTGGLQPLGDSDTTTLFRDLEHELEVMVKRYHVPPTDLEKIFQVNTIIQLPAEGFPFSSNLHRKPNINIECVWNVQDRYLWTCIQTFAIKCICVNSLGNHDRKMA